jgi:hypothetical protein
MPKILMLTTDQAIDRRILLEADALAADGWEVTILAMPGSGSGESRVVRAAADDPSRLPVRPTIRLHERTMDELAEIRRLAPSRQPG